MASLPTTSDAVYTRSWVVDLILDLAGYTADKSLADAVAVEPAVGEGAFLTAMIERLVRSCKKQRRPILDCLSSIQAYDVNLSAAEAARKAAYSKLIDLKVSDEIAQHLVKNWIQARDYLLAIGKQFHSKHKNGSKYPSKLQVDFVIGNPPYIRLEEIPEERNTSYRKLFPTMTGRADIYVAFYEAALRQLKPGGVCAYICADRWMLNQYGKDLRRMITSDYCVEIVIEMHQAEAFETDVDSYPAVTIIRREKQGRAIVASATPEGNQTAAGAISRVLWDLKATGQDRLHTEGLRAYRTDAWFHDAEPWPCTSPDRLALLRKLEQAFYLLESEITQTKVGIGVATGADEVYITKDKDLVEESRLLPLAITDHIKAGILQWSGHYLVNPWAPDGLVDLENYPKLRHYFEQNAWQLKGRHIAQGKSVAWYKTIDRVDQTLLNQPKLYIPDIKNRIHPVLDRGETYPHHNLYFVKSGKWNLEVLGALLMSDVGKFFVECYGVRMRGGYLRMQAQYLRRICLPIPESISKQQAKQLINAFRERNTALATSVAFELYGISEIPT